MPDYITKKKFIFYSIMLFVIIFMIIIFVFRNQQLRHIMSISTENIVDKVFFTKNPQFFSAEFNKEILSNPKFLKMEKYGGNFFNLEIMGLGKQNPFALPAPIAKPADAVVDGVEDNLNSPTTTEFIDNFN
ncbi:MAG: hypothetical protein U9O66_03720 [Patescibacteria group bacterium]|nr:hypothetical protein [Patescibacteria group bacterium]